MIKLPLPYTWPEALCRDSTTSYSLKEQHLLGLNQINFVMGCHLMEGNCQIQPSVAISWLHIIFISVIVVQNVRSRNLSNNIWSLWSDCSRYDLFCCAFFFCQELYRNLLARLVVSRKQRIWRFRFECVVTYQNNLICEVKAFKANPEDLKRQLFVFYHVNKRKQIGIMLNITLVPSMSSMITKHGN